MFPLTLAILKLAALSLANLMQPVVVGGAREPKCLHEGGRVDVFPEF